MNTKPTTLLIGNHLSGAGVNPSVCESLAVRLRERGWQVLTTSGKLGRIARLCDMLGTVWSARQDFDVAHVDVYSGKAFLWAEAAGNLLRLIGKPYVVTLRGGDLARFARRRRRRFTRILNGAAAVTTPSRFLFDHFEATNQRISRIATSTATPSLREHPAAHHRGSTGQTINRSTAPIHLIPNPIDVAAYRYRPRTAPQPRLVWLRAFHRIYEPELAVTALSELVREFPAAQLVMIGPDKGDGSLARTRRMAERRGLGQHILFPGAAAKTALPGLLDRGDIFLNTSRVDNTPVSVLEAMAGGLCIVSTDAGGMSYLLRHEHDGLLTPCGRPAEMASAVRRLLRQPALAGELSRNARRNAESYDWSTILPLWERLFQTTVGA
ncbi:MAG: glycosyltransferase family 4 protein [Bryobacterales bacterium]